MFQQWRIVFERSNGAALVHDADGENDNARVGIPEHGWKSCNVVGKCKNDDTLNVIGELHYKTDTIHGYFSRRYKTPGHYQAQQH